MRTTLTLDDDVRRLLEDEAHRLRRPWKQIVNDAIRRGLSPHTARGRSQPAYRVTPHETRLEAGLDITGFNRLADELEDESVVSAARRTRQR